jgi:PEP-CTERM motif
MRLLSSQASWLSLGAFCLLGVPLPASATTLLGDVISGSYDYPCVGCADVGGFWYTTNPFVVDGTVETSLQIGNPTYFSKWDVSFGANSVTLTMAPAPFSSVSYSPDPFNGPVFTVLSGNSFASVTGIRANNPDCIPCNPITAFVLGDSLYINWQGAGGGVGDTVHIDFTVGDPIAAAVPEPSTLGLIGIGLLGLGGMTRRRRHRASGQS